MFHPRKERARGPLWFLLLLPLGLRLPQCGSLLPGILGPPRVDYEGLRADPSKLDAFLEELSRIPFDELSRNARMAVLINAYNAFTLRLILDFWPLESIRDIPAGRRWKDRRWRLGGRRLSLEEIEHAYLRKRFRDPRIHFAINCASNGCPPLRGEAYEPSRLEGQLEDQARRMHADPRWFRLAKGEAELTFLYLWYRGDFEQVAGSVLGYASRYSGELERALESGEEITTRWLPWDWDLNVRKP